MIGSRERLRCLFQKPGGKARQKLQKGLIFGTVNASAPSQGSRAALIEKEVTGTAFITRDAVELWSEGTERSDLVCASSSH